MEIAFQDWLDLLLRWLHVITAIAWIGSSFYFIWLDLSLKKTKDEEFGVFGENWSVHGGGFYHSKKYTIAPEKMPQDLKWFKYEAYSTWLSGFLLMAIIYYWSAETFLIDDRKIALQHWQAILISIGFLALGWVLYDLLCKYLIGKKKDIVLSLAVFLLIVGGAILLEQVFSDRAALIHVGAIIGSMMVGNVFFIIIPNQKKVVAALIKGEAPDPQLGREAKTRSTHNNYLTLPALFMMISIHYPIVALPNRIWVVVAFVLLIGGILRNFFNTYHGPSKWRDLVWQFPVAGALTIILVLITSYSPQIVSSKKLVLNSVSAMEIVNKRCVSCHSQIPMDDNFDRPPGGIILEKLADVIKWRKLILSQAIHSQAMPPANKTNMTIQERVALGVWLKRTDN